MKSPVISKIGPAALVVLLLAAAAPLAGQNVQLTLNRNSISFPAADPDTTSLIQANNTVRVQVRITAGGGGRPWQLTLRANGDLSDLLSLASIDISNVRWTSTSAPPFRDGTLAANIDQVGASGNGNVNKTGEMTFILRNQWTYWAGYYTQSVTFTLSQI